MVDTYFAKLGASLEVVERFFELSEVKNLIDYRLNLMLCHSVHHGLKSIAMTDCDPLQLDLTGDDQTERGRHGTA